LAEAEDGRVIRMLNLSEEQNQFSMGHNAVSQPKPTFAIHWRDERRRFSIGRPAVEKFDAGAGWINAMLPGSGIVDHRGMNAVSVADLANEGIAKKPERQAVGEGHGKITIRSDPAIGLLEKPVVLRDSLSAPIRALGRCAKQQCGNTNMGQGIQNNIQQGFELMIRKIE
jgi:hypothetical protein